MNIIPISESEALPYSSQEPMQLDTPYEKKLKGRLWIKVIEARGLAIKDITGSSDPYVILDIANHRLKTTTIQRNLNPSWNEEFKVNIFDEATELKVVVMDEDTYKHDDFMGRFSIPLKDLLNGNQIDEWYKLRPRKWTEKVSGEVHLQLQYTRMEDCRVPQRVDSLHKVLQDKYNFDYFHKFLIEDYSEENLLFWKAVEEYKQKVAAAKLEIVEVNKKIKEGSMKKEDMFTTYTKLKDKLFLDAKHIYDLYIKPGSKLEVNLDGEIKESLGKFFKDKDKYKMESNLFEQAQNVVFNTIESDCYPRFLKSSMYQVLCESLFWVQNFKEFSQDRKLEALYRLSQVLTPQEKQFLREALDPERTLYRTSRALRALSKMSIKARVIADYTPEEDEDHNLKVKKGDLVLVNHVDQVTGLWSCELDARVGFIPSSYLTTNIPENVNKTALPTAYDIIQKEAKMKMIQNTQNKPPKRKSGGLDEATKRSIINGTYRPRPRTSNQYSDTSKTLSPVQTNSPRSSSPMGSVKVTHHIPQHVRRTKSFDVSPVKNELKHEMENKRGSVKHIAHHRKQSVADLVELWNRNANNSKQQPSFVKKKTM